LESARGPGSQFRLTDHATPLYATCDGWSRILQQLPAGQIVTFTGVEGHFTRVRAAGVDRYIAATAGAEPLVASEETFGAAAAVALRDGVCRAERFHGWRRSGSNIAHRHPRIAETAGSPRAGGSRGSRAVAHRQSRQRSQHEARRTTRRHTRAAERRHRIRAM